MNTLSQINTGSYTIRGVSVAGIYTSFQVPELGVLLDLGICPRTFAGTHDVFLSHVHGDHIGGLAAFLGMRDMLGMPVVRIHAPEEHMLDLDDLIRVTSRIHRYNPSNIRLVPMRAGLDVTLRKNVTVRPFRTWHSMPSLGYQFVLRKEKLRAEFAGLPGEEIGRRRKAGEQMTETTESLELAYATDTMSKVLETAPNLFQSRVTILESTYVEADRTSEHATKVGHMHLRDIAARKLDFKNEHLVLMHFSQSCSPFKTAEYVAEAMAGTTPAVHTFGTNQVDWFG